MTPPIPASVGRYRIDAVIGRGAMGVIYRGHDPRIDRPVAIKVVATGLLGGSEGEAFRRRFLREAQAAGRCVHPNIVAIYDYDMHEGAPFIAMEFVDGVSLRQVLERGIRLSPVEAASLVLQVLDALACAHAVGVVHRDVKPANILVMRDGRVKVADFGISRVESSDLTSAGGLIGTPGYMSPEQCDGGEVDARTDIFSTAAVLHELIAGTRAFPGRSFGEVRRRIVQEPSPDLPPAVAAAAGGIAAVIARGLAKRPEQRFGSAAEMREALRMAMQGLGPPGGAGNDTTMVAPAAAAVPSPPPQPFVPGLDPGMAASQPGSIGPHADQVLRTLEQVLARHLGPIARILVRKAAAAAPTLEALCDTVAGNIADLAERNAFRAETRRLLGAAAGMTGAGSGSLGAGGQAGGSTGEGSSGAWQVDPAEVERAHRALAVHLGPVARVLARRAAATARTADELWAALASQITCDDERAAFLSRRGPSGRSG